MPKTVLGLEPLDNFHVLHAFLLLYQCCPVRNGLPVLFSMDGKYEAGPVTFLTSLMALPTLEPVGVDTFS